MVVALSGPGESAARQGPRPAVSVVVPFAGEEREARSLLAALARLELGPHDQLLVVDNSTSGVLAPLLAAGHELTSVAEVVRADDEWSSYYARNRGAEVAGNAWLLFVDSDCLPDPDLIDRYFDQPLPERCGVVAGAVEAADGESGLIARYARSRGHISERFHLDRDPYPAGITANLLVCQAAWDSLGGFQEGIRSGGDLDLCWRLQAAGWGFVHRPRARVEHRHVTTLKGLLRKTRRHAAGRLWLNRGHPGSFPRPPAAMALARCAAAAPFLLLTLRPRRAIFKLLDAAWVLADQWGYLIGDNRAERAGTAPPTAIGERRRRLVVMTDAYPARSETFIYREIEALRKRGLDVRIVSSARPSRIERRVARDPALHYMSDSPLPEKLGSLVWLLARHPLAAIRDRRLRKALGPEEGWPLAAIAPLARRMACAKAQHVHVHFAAGAAAHALRVSQVLGTTYSVIGHGYDVFKRPRNMKAKLEGASLVLAPCEYTAREMQRMVPRLGRVEVVIMGVDGDEFARASAPPNEGVVAAVGRLVEKKGFADLVRAAALVPREQLSRLLLVGDGPLRGRLLELAAESGLGERFELVDGWGAAPVRAALERSDLLAMPAVIAPDGDRDAMPVVVKEAMAMELPIVASDAVGLPELVSPEWGRLVPPGDPRALAAAFEELLALPAAERARMGARARDHVLRRCSIPGEAARLEGLLAPFM